VAEGKVTRAFCRLVQTPARALSARLRMAASVEGPARALDRVAWGAGLKRRDVLALARGEAPVDAEVAVALADSLGVELFALAYRAAMEQRQVGAGETVPFVLSTADEDRALDVVEQSWRLDAFARNPVAVWAHDYTLPPVGRWVNVRVEGEPPVLRGEFQPVPADSAYELGRVVREQVRGGFIRAASVGFLPHDVTLRSRLPKDDPAHGEHGFLLGDNELLEVSLVSVPANAHAIAEAGLDAWLAETMREEREKRERDPLLAHDDPRDSAPLGLPWLGTRRVGG